MRNNKSGSITITASVNQGLQYRAHGRGSYTELCSFVSALLYSRYLSLPRYADLGLYSFGSSYRAECSAGRGLGAYLTYTFPHLLVLPIGIYNYLNYILVLWTRIIHVKILSTS